MNPRLFAWIAGTLLVLVGAGGFVPALLVTVDDPLRVAAGVGDPQLLGFFPVSPVLNAVHLALGLWGLVAGRTYNAALTFARRAAIVAAVLTLAGMVPGLDIGFGGVPLYGNNLLLHGLLALASALFGWLYRRSPATVALDAPDEDDELEATAF